MTDRLEHRAGELASQAVLRTSREQLAVILDGIADGVIARDSAGRTIYANEAAARVLGFSSRREVLETPVHDLPKRLLISDEEGRPVPVEELPVSRALEGEEPPDALLRMHVKDTGEERWAVVKARPVRDEQGELALAIVMFEDITEHRRREERQRLLATVSKVLAGSLDYRVTVERVAHLAVPDFADWCAVDLLGPRDRLERAVAHAGVAGGTGAEGVDESGRAAVAVEMGDAPVEIREVLRTGRSQLWIAEGRDSWSRAELTHAKARPALASRIVVPLRARDRVLGAMTFVVHAPRAYCEDDVGFADELANRAALALDNARLYGEHRRIAQTLQASLLPPRLPQPPRFDVEARFRAGDELGEVGGDFFDLFETPSGAYAAVIGDVTGKGAEAAAVTALARHTLRAAAVSGESPAPALRFLNDAILREARSERLVTAGFVLLRDDDDDRSLATLAMAGHPLPMVVRRDGSVEVAGRPGTILGLSPDPELIEWRTELRLGEKLVLYTDGVTEARTSTGLLGTEGLSALLGSCGALGAAATAERIERAVVGKTTQLRDDMAVLVLQRRS